MENVNQSSYSFTQTASEFSATQYGGIFYSHDLNSVILEDVNSSSIYDLYFGKDFSFGDLDLDSLRPLLENAGIDTSDFDSILNLGTELENFLLDLFPTYNFLIGRNYSQTVSSLCQERAGDFTTDAECLRLSGIGYVIQYNFTAIHVAPLYQMIADEALIREATGNTEFKIQTTLHPLPITSAEESIGKADDAFTAWFLIVLGFPFIAGSFATFVVQERESKAKHLQTVAGVKPSAYWISTFLWDVANYVIPCGITIILMFAFSIDIMTTTENGK